MAAQNNQKFCVNMIRKLTTGLSIALTEGEAPSFQKLLIAVCEDLNLEYEFNDPEVILGKSFPQLAEEIVSEITKTGKKGISRKRAELKFKRSICKACDLIPVNDISKKFRSIFKKIPIQWVITTNYDFLLEDVIPGSVSLLPDQILNTRPDYIPIYHLHGHRRSPSSIIVTDSDYIKLLTPAEYRQLKLNLLLTEATTLMLGYSLGDVNVKTAIEWSRSFKNERGLRNEPYQSLVVQALYVRGKPKKAPYIGVNGETIIETGDLLLFLKQIRKSIRKREKEHNQAIKNIDEWLDGVSSSSLVAEDPVAREEFIKTISQFPRCYDVHALINFLNSVLDPIWSQAREPGGFSYYNHYLDVLLDIFVHLPIDVVHPSLFLNIADRLDGVSYYVEADGSRIVGSSWDASNNWRVRKSEIPDEMKRELIKFAKRHGSYRLMELLRDT